MPQTQIVLSLHFCGLIVYIMTLILQTLTIGYSRTHSRKYQKSSTSDCKDMRIRKLEFDAMHCSFDETLIISLQIRSNLPQSQIF